MHHPFNLLLLYGGKSGEHEVSLISAASVLKHLDANRYNIIPVSMDKEGQCYLNDYQELLTYPESLPVITDHSQPLDSLLRHGKLAIEADVVFPMMHGPLYEDGCLQGLLELAGVAYVGSSVLSSAIGMDKDIARRLLDVEGIQIARYRSWPGHASSTDTQQFCQQTVAELGWPLFVKPCSLGSSVGTHKVYHIEGLMEAIADARRYDETILVEAFVKGREIELAVLENISPHAPPKVSVPGEIRVNPEDGFYSYVAKYAKDAKTDLIVPAQLDDALIRRLQQAAASIFTRFKCTGMARVDFFVDDQRNEIYFNEINTIPGFTPLSMYPMLWKASGLPYSALLDNLVDLALLRHRYRQELVKYYQ